MVIVDFTNGFGNNIFQYVASRQLAEFHNQELYGLCSENYYAKSHLENIGIVFLSEIPKIQDLVRVSDSNYVKCFDKQLGKKSFLLSGYFEDYRFYKNNRQTIKQWFPEVKKRETNDLVFHFRGTDRLLYRNTFDYKPTAESFLRAISSFEFENFYVVTDMPTWNYLTPTQIQNMACHVAIPPDNMVDIDSAVKYFNSIVKALSQYNPVYKRRNVLEDFNFIRSCDNILFEHGTLSWWAAFLSDAKKVGVYGPWRPWKGDSNKNLSQVPLDGWFKWR